MYPRLACKINLHPDRVILSQKDREVCFEVHGQSVDALSKLFALMDGTKSLEELQQTLSLTDELGEMVRSLNAQGLLDDASVAKHARETVQTVGQFVRELLCNHARENRFWHLLETDDSESLTNVLYGFAIESYHFFDYQHRSRVSGLTFQPSVTVRQLVDDIYRQSGAQADGLRQSLSTIGISDNALKDTLPLPPTMALCQGISFWANFDTQFYLTILGVLMEKIYLDFERYGAACESLTLEPHFMETIRLLVPELMSARKGLVDYGFQEMAPLDISTHQRFVRQTYLLVDMLNGFYNAIADHYWGTSHLLRRLSVI